MKLRRHKKRMLLRQLGRRTSKLIMGLGHRMSKFYNFHQTAIRGNSGKNKPRFLQFPDKIGINFKTMAMAFRDFGAAVGRAGNRPLFKNRRICAQTHRPAIIIFSQFCLLFRHYVYNRIFGIGIDFNRVGICPAQNITREFHHGKLHPVAQSEKRNFILARVLDNFYFTRHSG